MLGSTGLCFFCNFVITKFNTNHIFFNCFILLYLTLFCRNICLSKQNLCANQIKINYTRF